MSDDSYTDKEAEENARYQKELDESFENDVSLAMAEQAEFYGDVETDQMTVAIEEQAEDDPFLKADLEMRNAEFGEIPDVYPYNDNALNASIINRRENEESEEFREEQLLAQLADEAEMGELFSADSTKEKIIITDDESLIAVLDKPIMSLDFSGVVQAEPDDFDAEAVKREPSVEEAKHIPVMTKEEFVAAYPTSPVTERNTYATPEGNGGMRFFWIIVGLVVLIYGVYQMGAKSNEPWTAEKEQEAVSGCRKWGGEVVRSGDGSYVGCSINGGPPD